MNEINSLTKINAIPYFIPKSNEKLAKVYTRYSAKPLSSSDLNTIDFYIRKLVSEQIFEDNFYVCDLGQVVRCYCAWRRSLFRIAPFYAVKCHPNPAIISTLAAIGSGFDCASPSEIELVVGLGIHANRIIYANPCKTASDLRFARKMGVQIATFDTISELDKVAINCPNMLMVLRIHADDPDARCQLGNKFGADPEIWKELLYAAKYRAINVIGVSFHVGSGASSVNAFNRAIASVYTLFNIATKMGFYFELVNIGGGFTAYLDEYRYATLGYTANVIIRTLKYFFPETRGYTMIAEPGRYIVEKACTMVTQIFGRRPNRRIDLDVYTRKAQSQKMDYWITDGLYGSMNCVIYDHACLKPFPVIDYRNRTNYLTTLFGPTCDGLDTVVRDVMLPEMKNGDWIGFHDMGAYTIAGAANFNGIKANSVKFWYIYAK